MSTVPWFWYGRVSDVVPTPTDLRNVPRFLKRGAAPTPHAIDASFKTSHVPVLLMTPPNETPMFAPAPLHVVMALVLSVRLEMPFAAVPEMLSAPSKFVIAAVPNDPPL